MIARKLPTHTSRPPQGSTSGPSPHSLTSLPPRPRPTLLEVQKPAGQNADVASTDPFEEELVRQMNQLRLYALRLCNNVSLAEDLIQDTLLNAWLARDRFQAGTNLKAWCTTILRNVFFSYKRRSWRMLPLADEAVANLPSRTADGGAALDLLAVRNAMALLPTEQREALLLIGAGSLSYAEAAEICDCAIGTVKSRVSRARLRLAALIAENKAGFNTDAGISAEAALDDLLAQVAVITQKTSGRSRARLTGAVTSEVHSDPALQSLPVLAPC